MSPSLDGTLPEYVISQEDNSPLTLYIDFSQFLKVKFCKNLCTVPLDSCTVVTSQILEECDLRGRHTRN